MVTKLVVYNNPCYGIKYHATIDFEAGSVLYLNSFYLIPRDNVNSIASLLKMLHDWKQVYGTSTRLIDGYEWNVKTFGQYDKEYKGNCVKPENFDDFMKKLENLIGRHLTYTEHEPNHVNVTTILEGRSQC